VLGCSKYTISKSSRRDIEIAAIVNRAVLYNWPLVIDGEYHKMLSALCDPSMPRNLIIQANKTAADILGMFSAWTFITAEWGVHPSDDIVQEGAAVIPAWLQRMALQKFSLPESSRPLPLRVLDDMDCWLQDSSAIVKAKKLLLTTNTSEAKARCFASFIQQFIESKKLAVVGLGSKSASMAAIHILRRRGEECIFLGFNTFQQLMQSTRMTLLSLQHVNDILAEAGALAATETVHHKGEAGWLLSADWWNQERTAHHTRLQIRYG